MQVYTRDDNSNGHNVAACTEEIKTDISNEKSGKSNLGSERVIYQQQQTLPGYSSNILSGFPVNASSACVEEIKTEILNEKPGNCDLGIEETIYQQQQNLPGHRSNTLGDRPVVVKKSFL